MAAYRGIGWKLGAILYAVSINAKVPLCGSLVMEALSSTRIVAFRGWKIQTPEQVEAGLKICSNALSFQSLKSSVRSQLILRRLVTSGTRIKSTWISCSSVVHELRCWQEATDKSFACGIILSDGERIQRLRDGLFAVSVSQL